MRDADGLLARTRAFAAEQRAERQRRRALDPADFRRLREIGLQHASVPVGHGRLWEGARRSSRALGDAHRILGAGDPSLALAASMHPSVLAFWRGTEPPGGTPAAALEAWKAQRRMVFETAIGDAWWGTITSESGSGGDLSRT